MARNLRFKWKDLSRIVSRLLSPASLLLAILINDALTLGLENPISSAVFLISTSRILELGLRLEVEKTGEVKISVLHVLAASAAGVFFFTQTQTLFSQFFSVVVLSVVLVAQGLSGVVAAKKNIQGRLEQFFFISSMPYIFILACVSLQAQLDYIIPSYVFFGGAVISAVLYVIVCVRDREIFRVIIRKKDYKFEASYVVNYISENAVPFAIYFTSQTFFLQYLIIERPLRLYRDFLSELMRPKVISASNDVLTDRAPAMVFSISVIPLIAVYLIGYQLLTGLETSLTLAVFLAVLFSLNVYILKEYFDFIRTNSASLIFRAHLIQAAAVALVAAGLLQLNAVSYLPLAGLLGMILLTLQIRSHR